ncbi:lipopolysaccharide biosynthesis protein [Aerococcus urinaeequi]|uniref:lipopolysaccharide biosynthesis protein n=1 Tax=Aerococcus urinaeequi TaxID=51665 RepID=UPI00288F3E00|nr:oligosaccharide flippase family protein [Aerococcus urinaeequi]MDT2761852.1 oligosaccharide flippase family protein [Aerococcus urinaeequi]
MSSINKFIKNSAVFGVSNFASKLLVFLLLPFYTRVLTPSEFGSADVIISVITLLIPIFTLCVSEGALRFSLSKTTDSKKVFSYGFTVIIIGFIFLLLLYPLLSKIPLFVNHLNLFYLILITSELNNYFNRFLRGIGKIKLIGFIGVTSTVTLIMFNILFLVVFKWGINGYLLSYFFMNLISAVVLFFGGKLYKFIIFSKIEINLIEEMNKFNIPLIPNRISWILISSFNKYSISYFLGYSFVGIFSAANRIPSIITAVYGIIQQALLLVVIEEYEEKNESKIFIKIYRALSTILIIIVAVINILIKPMAPLLFSNHFYDAFKYAPIMVLTAYFGAMHGNLTTIFNAKKNTRILFQNSLLGMMLIISLSILIVPKFGLYGATFISLAVYFLMWYRLYYITSKTISFDHDLKIDFICYIAVFLQWVISLISEGIIYYSLSISILFIILFVNRNELYVLYKSIKYKGYEFKRYILSRRKIK